MNANKLTTFKLWYIAFLERKPRGLKERLFYCFCYILSFIYGLVINLRNFLYDYGIKKSYKAQAKVISIGNISWAGTGKTSLVALIYRQLVNKYSIAILRRGYGNDEEYLLKETSQAVYSAKDRVSLAKELSGKYQLLVLDDGFQYRKLKRNVNIVIIGAREFLTSIKLIPVSFFREGLKAVKRANIVIINYSELLTHIDLVKTHLLEINKDLKIFLMNYKFSRLLDLKGKEYPLETIKDLPLAAFTAIGYPEGFFYKLNELKLLIKDKVVYPDHYVLNQQELEALENRLLSSGIENLIITSKDKYHIVDKVKKIKIFVLEVKLEIENQDNFISCIEEKLKK